MSSLVPVEINLSRYLPCGPVVKNLPVKAGDVGPIPDLETVHMLWGN